MTGNLVVERLPCTLGAIVRGVRLAQLDDPAWNAIEDVFHEHAVLVFPGQHLTEPEQASFARRFGEIEHVVASVDVVPISNQRADGQLLADSDPTMQILLGNEGWHTDSSYMPVSAKASMLSAHVIPPEGGQTEWADMRAAYDALDATMQARIAELCAYHSIRYSQQKAGLSIADRAYGADVAAVPLRPLVKRHAVTGRPALYIGRHAHAIPGLTGDESDRLLDELLNFACRAPRVYQHRWNPGDLVVWDNRCVLHRARPYEHSHARVMRHTRIAGDPTTEGWTTQANPEAPPERGD